MNSPAAASAHLMTLTDARVDAYVAQAASLLQAARLSAQFPSGGGSARAGSSAGGAMLAGYLRAMGSSLHRGLYPQLEVDGWAGLPTFKEWTRVMADADLCQSVLANLPRLDVVRDRSTRDPAYGKQLLKYLYYSDLQKLALPAFEQVHVKLQRRLSPQETQFQLVLDKLDARGLPLRCTAEVVQRSDATPYITLHGDRAEAKRELWGTIYRLVSLDAELTFLQLRSLAGLHVHSVTIGTVGPLLCGSLQLVEDSVAAGEWPVTLTRRSDTAILTCSVESVTREEGPDRDNDPLSPLRAQSLSAAARTEYEQARLRHGYRVSKDRKFVADSASLPAIKALCEQARTSNIIYALPT